VSQFFICSNCGGSGGTYEAGETDTCYHCMGDGYVPLHIAHADRMRNLANAVGVKIVEKMIQLADSNPDGEGWAFQAAENQLHPSDYTQVMAMDQSGHALTAIEKLPEDIRSALCELVGIPLGQECQPRQDDNRSDSVVSRPIFTVVSPDDEVS